MGVGGGRKGGMNWEIRTGNIQTTICNIGSWWGAAVFCDPPII